MEVESDASWNLPGPSSRHCSALPMPLPSTSSSSHSSGVRKNLFKRDEKDDLVSSQPKRARKGKDKAWNNDFYPEDFEFSDDDEFVPVIHEPIGVSKKSVALPVIEDDPTMHIKYRRVLKHIPEIPYVPIASCDGSRVYLRVFPEKQVQETMAPSKDRKKMSVNLLSASFRDLRKEIEISKNRFHETLARVVNIENLGGENLEVAVQEDLWVEKYKPKSYMDLLSEETVNHKLLHWLKLWDKTVFGNDYLAKYKETKEKYSTLEAKEKEKETFNYAYKQLHVEDEDYDENGRPRQKIALLHGPPGLGKTTCAHIIARHAGYKVVELNASDDRSVDIFRKTLDSTTQMRPEVFQDGRPTCLVIDEIDGAPTDTVNILIDLITGKAVEKGKQKLKKVLKRPIICICNDLFALSLRNLRQHAFVMPFETIPLTSLIERLKEISEKENLGLDNITLSKLCEKTECDVRSCLSTMQFVKKNSRGGGSGLSNDIFRQLARKDKNKGIFAVWNEIFTLPQGKKNADDEDSSKSGVRFSNILSTVQSFGDYEKLQSGVFENYLHMKFRDSYFQSIISGLHWTQWFESIKGHIDKSQNYSLYGYLPIYFVNGHFLYATKNAFKLSYPSAEKLARVRKFKSVVQSQMSDLSGSIGRFLNESNMILDVIPSLISILQPGTIRPITTQLWNTKERETVHNIVSTMIAYNLSYSQQKQADGSWAFVLEPNIEDIGRFNMQDTGSGKRHFPSTVKQLVAREINMEKLRRNEFDTSAFSGSANAGNEKMEVQVNSEEIIQNIDTNVRKDNTAPPIAETSTSVKSVGSKNSTNPNSMSVNKNPWNRQNSSAEILKKNLAVKAAFVPKDFFGRPIVRTAETVKADQEKQKQTGDIWYKYKEGFSNAVRKNLKLKDLI